MKNVLKLLGIITLVVVIGFLVIACGDNDNGSGGKIDYTTNSVDELAAWLAKQPVNAASDPYTIKLQVNDLTDFGALRTKLISAGKYVYLDFSGSPLTTIPSSAFSLCAPLTGITIPDSVTSIGSGAFSGTTWINNQQDGIIYAGKVAYIYKGTMPANTSIKLLDGTKVIADYAFYQCTSLTSVTIPNSVTSIGNFAFYSCTSLTSVRFERADTTFGYGSFDPFYTDSLKIAYSAGGIGTYTLTNTGWSKLL